MESNFDQKEKNIIAFWNKFRIFEKSVAGRKSSRKGKKRKDFVFYEGPPTANARPGIHHVETRVFKDIICRYKTMAGFRVQRRAGWDTHGLPVELEIEKKLGLAQKKDIEKYGIAEFNKKCKESVWEYKKEWESLTERIGFWLDMQNPYITYDRNYMESVWFILKAAWEKKLLFQDFKVVPYCPRCGTPLSSHEVAQGYKRVKEPSIYVKLAIINPEFKGCSLLVWTTTPWTLPANVAVAANEKIEYAKVRAKGQAGEECLILAKERLSALGVEYEILASLPGRDLIGLRYQPVFSFDEDGVSAHKVIPGDFVSLEEGTGLVHIAPAFGEDDMKAVKEQNKILRKNNLPEIPVVVPVSKDGLFNLDVKQLAGLFIKDADPVIIEDLKKRGLLFREEMYEHDYPFCWRCKTPLLYYATKSWFIEMTRLRDGLMGNNKKINWVPAYLKEGRFGEWLKEVKDWAISRERYWATPLPVWQCEKCGQTEVAGSVTELLSKKYSANRYFIFRHGESERQKQKISSCWPEPNPLALTPAGRKAVSARAAKLKKEKIDLIISSDLLRTKETANIIAEATGAGVVYDKRIREFNVGIFNGNDPKNAWDYLNKCEAKTEAVLPKGESLKGMQKRMYEFLSDIDKKYENQNIVIVSHEFPLTLLEWTLKGVDLKDTVERRYSGKIKKIATAEAREIEFKKLPLNENMEIDLHRPYIDAVKFLCPGCGGPMERVPEVLDCWFDSGSMPFAQVHWPFDCAQGRPFGEKKSGKKLAPPELFPADYISEAIDQTRGWFYTLLAISTVLDFGVPYKNVVSLGHVLDEKGEKMSKSKGNTVSPWAMIEKYSADAVRWYFYTVNNPGDSKLFAEKDIDLAMKKFILTFWNCYFFLETYGKRSKTGRMTGKPKDILDRWIVSKTNLLAGQVTRMLESYDITGSARAIEKFTINDLSLWYVRRSRRRLQQPQNKAEFDEASKVLSHVLSVLAKLSAPFIPFLSEDIHQKLNGFNYKSASSVHLEDWPKASKNLIDSGLNERMEQIRELVTLALAERARLGIRIRQPLLELRVKPLRRTGGKTFKYERGLEELIENELNVKRVVFDDGLSAPLRFDTNITPELKEEGVVREFMRHLQDARKKSGYTPKDKIIIEAAAGDSLKNSIAKHQKRILADTRAKKIAFRDIPSKTAGESIKTDLGELWFAIKKC